MHGLESDAFDSHVILAKALLKEHKLHHKRQNRVQGKNCADCDPSVMWEIVCDGVPEV